ncbi:MAG: DUF1559 domain-containing protein [bacterium]|nr:DUF1559 domain-containing protein [bacterium]
MLLPALSQAREKARQAVCINNLKQLGLVMNMYADDTGGYLPDVYAINDPQFLFYRTFWWILKEAGYYGSDEPGNFYRAFKNGHCPKKDLVYGDTQSWVPGELYQNFGYYGYNRTLGAQYKKAYAVFKYDLSKKIMVTDAARYYFDWWYYDPDNYALWNLYSVYLGARHNDGANCLFMDGHVEWIKKDLIQSYQYPYFEN